MVDVKGEKGEIIAKVGSKREALWYKVKISAEKILENAESEVEIQTEVIKIAKLKIAEEKEKFKQLSFLYFCMAEEEEKKEEETSEEEEE